MPWFSGWPAGRGRIVSRLELRQIDSVEALRGVAAAWDRLWERSEVALPTARAELVAQWVEHFSPRARLRVLAVERDGELVAALPLDGRRTHHLLPVGDLTWNHWSPNGELLLDPQADPQAVLDVLASGLADTPWPLLWFELVPFDTPRWQSLIAALRSRGLATDVHPRYRIGQTEIRGRFDDYFVKRPKAHRRSLRKRVRRLEQEGPIELKLYSRFTPEEVDQRLREAFEIEDLGWKNAGGGSVLSTPGMFEFYRRQAHCLAEWGYLRLAFLEHRGKPIAFEFGWTAKGVYFGFKVGYDPAYRRHSPGNLLRMRLIGALHERPGHTLVDFQGPLNEALACWATCSYPIGRLVIAPPRFTSRTLMAGYRTLAPLVRRLRRAADGVPTSSATV